MTTLYEILNANETATPEEIKDAYRVMAMKWHPDRNLNNRSQAEAKFKEIGTAYKALYDPVQRKDYDEWLANERKQSSQHSYTKTEDMSDKDADNMFFESMLDLAIEIAKRGYVEEVIVKALLALDCPESVANAVAKKAFNSAVYKRDNNATEAGGKYTNGMDSIEGVEWSELEPYYTAVISGVYANNRMSEGEYLDCLGREKKQTKGFLISFAVMFAGLLTATIKPLETFGSFVALASGLGFVYVLVWSIFTSKKEFRREKALRFYQTAFECYHNGRRLWTSPDLVDS